MSRVEGQQEYMGTLEEDDAWDSNTYWVRVRFKDNLLERIQFTASECESIPFEDLDKDRED